MKELRVFNSRYEAKEECIKYFEDNKPGIFINKNTLEVTIGRRVIKFIPFISLHKVKWLKFDRVLNFSRHIKDEDLEEFRK